MTQEEKAKAYDKAIERAKEMIKAMTNIGGVAKVDDIQYLFPELKESEDERIREALISHFCGIRDNCSKDWYGFNINDVIAWIEKQGEQPKKHDVCDNCDQQGCCVSPCPMKLVEKHDGQESAAWSEEDDAVLDALIRHLEGEDIHVSPHLAVKCLKSLKERVQPKQEWSEEDKRKLRKIFATFELYKGLLPSSDSEYIDHCLSWLKSLSPQNTWKPSDEQMEALEKVTNYSAFHDAKYCVELKRLLGQLKAL